MLSWVKKILGISPPLSSRGNKVLLLIDWDNLFICLSRRFEVEEIQIERRINKLMNWVQENVGELLCDYNGSEQLCHGFVFTPEHISPKLQRMCAKNKLWLMVCPKKSNGGRVEVDTVDDNLIRFGKMMLRHSDVGSICLVSGDEDYLPLLEEARKCNVKIALIPPTLDSLSNNGGLVRFIDKRINGPRKMFVILDTIKI